jgi:hypothetical protein
MAEVEARRRSGGVRIEEEEALPLPLPLIKYCGSIEPHDCLHQHMEHIPYDAWRQECEPSPHNSARMKIEELLFYSGFCAMIRLKTYLKF